MKILDALERQDLGELQNILVKDPTAVDEKDGRGAPVPFLAAEMGNLEMVKYLVEYSRASMNAVDGRNRNILHYAASSGNVELCRYLVEKVGMDALSGDRDLVTPYQVAYEAGYAPLLAYFEEKYSAPYERMYHNPIRRGMFPDPSILCVGEDFYMVNSSFVFFPCIPISHSRDLVHWEIIGHAITNPAWSGLGSLEGGRGYWAPDISYDKGMFYITATYRLNDSDTPCRRQVVVSSDRPEGPYSEPAYIDEDGIDPSLFHDDDGRHYMLLNRGARILELSSDCKRQISEAKLLYYGDQKRAPEGPHLLKKDGWYYLFLAEGGTGEGHRITVARSRELFGNYEPCPYNPIMRQEDQGARIWRCGHGKPVQTPAGEWYMAYLCGRKLWRGGEAGPAICTMLGRETALDPIRWTEDGWPIVNELNGPSVLQKMPDLPAYEPAENPAMQWVTPREPDLDGIRVDGDTVILRGSRAPLSDVAARNLCLRRQTEFSFTASAQMRIPALSQGQEAGLVCYYDENSWVSFSLGHGTEGMFLQLKEHIGTSDRSYPKATLPKDASIGESLTLGVRVDGLQRQFYAKADGFSYEAERLDDVYYLCDEGVSIGKRFTGALVGMYAYGNGGDLNVEFRDFQYEIDHGKPV